MVFTMEIISAELSTAEMEAVGNLERREGRRTPGPLALSRISRGEVGVVWPGGDDAVTEGRRESAKTPTLVVTPPIRRV